MEKRRPKTITGFSKLSKRQKIKWLVDHFFKDADSVMKELTSYWHRDEAKQKVLDGFSENTVSNYYMPYGVAPNFLIDGKVYCVPMVIEESSVVAAAAAAAKYWLPRGGFKTTIIGTQKVGQVSFTWAGSPAKMDLLSDALEVEIRKDITDIVHNMEGRGGGVTRFIIKDLTDQEPHLYQLVGHFETVDSMGANFINSVLEQSAKTIERFFATGRDLTDIERDVTIVMSILSNYTPDCVVRAEVSCPIDDLGTFAEGMSAQTFADKFCRAVRIAHIDPYRATTHNKGIFNGIDAVVLATGNDFRAIEACGHTYASRDGQYRSLSHCSLEAGIFRFWIDIPLAVGTVGGLTSLHPIARRSLELLEHPTGPELMRIIASTGLAQNFAALRSLVTTGIQQGHMKMHLLNILQHLEASKEQEAAAVAHFCDQVVSYSAVREYLEQSQKS